MSAGHDVLKVDEVLYRTGRVNAGGSVSGDGERAARAFAAAHRKDDCLRLDFLYFAFAADAEDFVFGKVEDYRLFHYRNLKFSHLFNETIGIFRPGERFLESVQAESVVYALVEDSAEYSVPLDEDDVAAPGFFRSNSRRKPGRAASDDYEIVFVAYHYLSAPSLTLPVKRLEPASLKM